MGGLDLAFPEQLLPSAAGALVLVVVLVATGWSAGLRDEHSRRYTLSAGAGLLTTVAGWIVASADPAMLLANVLTWLGAAVFALQVWGLLTRGFTVALLLTLLRAEHPLGADALASRYRGGEGLRWVLRHRLAGMASAGLIHNGERVALQRSGLALARLYGVVVRFLGLQRTG